VRQSGSAAPSRMCLAGARPRALYPEGPEAEEFQRTASRLVEMQSKAYITAPHKG